MAIEETEFLDTGETEFLDTQDTEFLDSETPKGADVVYIPIYRLRRR